MSKLCLGMGAWQGRTGHCRRADCCRQPLQMECLQDRMWGVLRGVGEKGVRQEGQVETIIMGQWAYGEDSL